MTPKYILDGQKPIIEEDFTKWAEWFVTANHRVNKTVIEGSEISTIFLGVDVNFNSDGPPILFETMVFGGVLDRDRWRYATWDEAVLGHKEAVKLVTQNVERTP